MPNLLLSVAAMLFSPNLAPANTAITRCQVILIQNADLNWLEKGRRLALFVKPAMTPTEVQDLFGHPQSVSGEGCTLGEYYPQCNVSVLYVFDKAEGAYPTQPDGPPR